MGKLTIYLGDEEEQKLNAITDRLKKGITSEIPELKIDLSKSQIVKMAINGLHARLFQKKE
ncbi:hypothetical protein ACFLY8_02425 [Halobacteriota archaeon]